MASPIDTRHAPFVGATVNAGGTLIANKVTVGTAPSSDNSDHVKLGNTIVPVQSAIAMGLLSRMSGSLAEMNQPALVAAVKS